MTQGSSRAVTCFAPATVANVAVGFDVLGFSFDTLGDHVEVERTETSGVFLESVTGVADCPADGTQNTATVALASMVTALDLPFGFRIRLTKGIPLGSGMGGSAASAVGAVVAANALLDEPRALAELYDWALDGEAVASGARHADNVAPCLYGGLVAALPDTHVVSIPVPEGLVCVLARPDIRLDTKAQRGVLANQVPLGQYVEQSARLAAFVSACFSGDLDLLRTSMRDVIVEPQRAPAIPELHAVRQAVQGAGALACAIAGSGPSIFAWAEERDAEAVRAAASAAYAAAGLAHDVWVARVGGPGAHVLEGT